MHQRLNMVLDILGINKDEDSNNSSQLSEKSEDKSENPNDMYYYALKQEKKIKFDFQNAIDKIYIDSLQKKDPDYIIDNLYLGNILQARTKKLLKQKQITTVIQISQKPLKKPFPDDFEYHRFIITNESIFDVYSALLNIARCINAAMVHKKCIFIHDWVGFEKAPACVIAYLIIYKSKGFYKAYEILKKQRPCINISNQYRQILKGLQREFKKDLRQKLLERFKNMQLNLYVIISK